MRRTLSLLFVLLAFCLQAAAQFTPVPGARYRLREKASGQFLQMTTPAQKVGNADGDHLAGLSQEGSELLFALKDGSTTEYAVQCFETSLYLGAERWNSVINAAEPTYWTLEAQTDGSTTYIRLHQQGANPGYLKRDAGHDAIYVDGTEQAALLFEPVLSAEPTAKDPLLAALRQAQAANAYPHGAALQPGQYPQAAIDAAQRVADQADATQADIDAAIQALQAAMVMPQAGLYYRFQNTSFETWISLSDAETNLLSRAGDEADPRQIWKLEDRDGQLYLRNLYSGLYPQEIVGGTSNTSAVGAFQADKAFTFQLHAQGNATQAAAWNLLVGGNQINCENTGNLNKWNGDNAHFRIFQVEQSEQQLLAMAEDYAPRIDAPGQGPAQNYALRLGGPEGYVDCGQMTELSGLTTWSLQLWLSPAQWTEGATVLSRGDGLRLALGALAPDGTGSLSLTVDGQTVTAAQGLNRRGWNHITLICQGGQLSAVVNGALTPDVATLAPLPETTDNLILGGGLNGRIDELRLWRKAVDPTFDYFAHTTLNPYQPAWQDLIAYYKFDAVECPNVVDLKGLYKRPATWHNGLISPEQAQRERVTDNAGLPYLYCGAYSNNERFFDRQIPRPQYLLANDLIFLGIQSYSGGRCILKSPNSHGTLQGGASRINSSGDHVGVLKLDGTGMMTAPFDALLPVGQGFAIETWINLDEWTKGAVLFEKVNPEGACNIRVSLGDEGTLLIMCNGKTWTARTQFSYKAWHHLGISTTLGSPEGFLVELDGSGQTCKAPTDPPGVGTGFGEDCTTYIGRGIKGKLDDFATWNRSFTASELWQHAQDGLPQPTIGTGNASKSCLFRAGACWLFNNAKKPGYDYYSQDEFTRIMTSPYKNHKGWQMRLAVESHNGWQNTYNDAARRDQAAHDIVACIDDKYAGVEFDLEWAYSAWELNVLGELIKRTRELLPADKTLHLSIHGTAIGIVPQQYWQYIDGFTVQQYGPQANNFLWSRYCSEWDNLLSRGLPADKLYLSWASITSSGSAGGAVQGLAWGFFPEDHVVLVKEDKETTTKNGNTYTYSGPWQTYQRAKFATDHQAQGIFYWDMGNDLQLSNPNNLARHCNYGLAANADTLVTTVRLDASVKGDQPQQPDAIHAATATADAALQLCLQGRQLSFSLPQGQPREATLYATDGRAVLRTGRAQQGLNLSALPQGVYLLRLRDSLGREHAQKLVIR